MTMEKALTVPCPWCKAPIGKPCTDLYGGPRAVAHTERESMVRDMGNTRDDPPAGDGSGGQKH